MLCDLLVCGTCCSDFCLLCAADIWSLGVILFMLVCGQPPFQEANDSETLTMIMDCKYTVPAHVSSACKEWVVHSLKVSVRSMLRVWNRRQCWRERQLISASMSGCQDSEINTFDINGPSGTLWWLGSRMELFWFYFDLKYKDITSVLDKKALSACWSNLKVHHPLTAPEVH